MPKYVCSSEYDTFSSTDDNAAMEHLRNNPDHRIVMISEDLATGRVDVNVMQNEETE